MYKNISPPSNRYFATLNCALDPLNNPSQSNTTTPLIITAINDIIGDVTNDAKANEVGAEKIGFVLAFLIKMSYNTDNPYPIAVNTVAIKTVLNP
jgi:hypothetical protein